MCVIGPCMNDVISSRGKVFPPRAFAPADRKIKDDNQGPRYLHILAELSVLSIVLRDLDFYHDLLNHRMKIERPKCILNRMKNGDLEEISNDVLSDVLMVCVRVLRK